MFSRRKVFALTAAALVILGVACAREATVSEPPVGAEGAGREGLALKSEGAQEARRFSAEGGSGAVAALPTATLEAAAPDVVPAAQLPAVQLPASIADSKVIKTAEVHLRVEEGEFQDAFFRGNGVAEEFGGFVTNSSTSESDGRISSGTLTIRVPAEGFMSALAALRELGEVTSEQSSGRDVTSEFVDLEARLRHLKSQEAFFLRLMDEAKTISDMIQIQGQLASVQLQIEQTQGQLNLINDQTSFSTISVRIFEEGVAVGPAKGLGRAWEEAVAGFKTVVGGLIVASGWVAPFLAIGLAGYGLWRVSRLRKPKAA